VSSPAAEGGGPMSPTDGGAVMIELEGQLDGAVPDVPGETLIHGLNGATFAAVDDGGPISTTDDGGAAMTAGRCVVDMLVDGRT